MRSVSRGPCPRNLDGPQSSGHKERAKAIIYFTAVNPRESPFKFAQYKTEPVKQQLMRDYRQKCAYCESFIGHVTNPDIDHFRPKSAYRNASGDDVKPGYYWLASGWENLFLSCQLCNRPSWQLLADGSRMMVGKGTHFPLVDESKRATVPGAETDEEPLLLSPDQADVESHLEFREGGVVLPAVIGSGASVKGLRSIEIYGLQRAALVSQREKHLRGVKGAVARYIKERESFAISPNDSSVRERVREAMQEIIEYLCCRNEYLTLTRQYIAKHCSELVPLPKCTATSCIDGSCNAPRA